MSTYSKLNDVFSVFYSERCGVAETCNSEDHFVKMVCILRELDIRAIWDLQCPVSFTHGRWMRLTTFC